MQATEHRGRDGDGNDEVVGLEEAQYVQLDPPVSAAFSALAATSFDLQSRVGAALRQPANKMRSACPDAPPPMSDDPEESFSKTLAFGHNA